MVGWEITGADDEGLCSGPRGNELINRGWFNQGFQETLGVAALAARLLKLDVDQTRMALGHAASAMAGMMKNRGTDTKGFTAGSAAMHGVIAAELAAMGFTADRDILDGDIGVARLLGLEQRRPREDARRARVVGPGDPRVDDPAARVLRRRALEHGRAAAHPAPAPDSRRTRSSRSTSRSPTSSPTWCRIHAPQTGLEAKYSLEYDLAAIALDGRAGIHQYTDDAVQRPAAQALMERVTTVPVNGPLAEPRRAHAHERRAARGDASNRAHGNPADPLTDEEILGKFHECAATLAPEAQRNRIIDALRTARDARQRARARRRDGRGCELTLTPRSDPDDSL